MSIYIINTNKDENGFNEVHAITCSHLPDVSNRENLGFHPDENAAVNYAKKIGFYSADGCYYCCPRAHHG